MTPRARQEHDQRIGKCASVRREPSKRALAQELKMFGHGQKPMGLYGDTEGRLCVTDLIPRVTMLSWDGELLGQCCPMLKGAHGNHGDASGCLYLAGNPSRVTRLVP